MKRKILIAIAIILGFIGIGALSVTEFTVQQYGANWNFDWDTVHINRLHVGDGKFGIDSLGRIIQYNNLAPATGGQLQGDGSKFVVTAIGTSAQLWRVNAGATAAEWWTPTFLSVVDIAYDAGTHTVTNSGGTDAVIPLAVDDGATEGLASFSASDFTLTAGNAVIDYTNGQSATASLKGFLTSTDWTTFNNKTGLVAAPINLTAQTGNLNATAYSVPAADGYYRISMVATITTIASVSVDLIGQLRWVDANDGATKTFPGGGNINNMNRTQSNATTTGVVSFSTIAYVESSTNITYLTAFTSTAAGGQYDITVTVEKMTF